MKKSKIKSYLLRIIKLICFFGILGVLLYMFQCMYYPKYNTKEKGIYDQNAHAFYAEPENSLDVVFMGNSEAYSAFSPLELWNRQGVTSYVVAQGASAICEINHNLSELLKTQKPKLVFLEADVILSPHSDKVLLEKNTESELETNIPLVRYHNRWKYMSPSEWFAPVEYTWKSPSKGQMIISYSQPYKSRELELPDGADEKYKNGKISPVTKYYVEKIKSVCDSNNIKLAIVIIPNTLTGSVKNYNALQRYADSLGVPLLNLQKDAQKVGLDWTRDTRDGGVHLNTKGAYKVTMYIGDYIKNNYDIPDRRNEKDLAQLWDMDFISYRKAVGAYLK